MELRVLPPVQHPVQHQETWPEARRALRAASELGGFFALDTDPATPGAWEPVGALDPATLHRRIRDGRDLLAGLAAVPPSGIEERVVASVVMQGLAARLIGPPLGAAVLAGVGLELSPDQVLWQPEAPGPVPMLVLDAGCWPLAVPGEAIDALRTRVLERLVRPLVDVVRSVARLAPALVWGNVASAVAGLAHTVAAERRAHAAAAHQLARGLLDEPPLAGLGRFERDRAFRRRTCCLYYRIPGAEVCGDCPLRDRGRDAYRRRTG